MSWQVVNLPNLTLVGTSAGSPTIGIGSLDDAESITIFMNTTAVGTSTGAGTMGLQISQFDPAIPLPTGVTQSTVWYSISTGLFSTTAVVTSSGVAFTLTNISYRGLRLTGFTSGAAGEIIARASKTIFV